MLLYPKTKKAKERLKEAGTDDWRVVKTKDRVQFSDKRGPWLLMSPSFDQHDRHARWIHEFDDGHFTVRDY